MRYVVFILLIALIVLIVSFALAVFIAGIALYKRLKVISKSAQPDKKPVEIKRKSISNSAINKIFGIDNALAGCKSCGDKTKKEGKSNGKK